MDLDTFAPAVDIEAEMAKEPDVRIDDTPEPAADVVTETSETSETVEPAAESEREQKVVPLAALSEARRHTKDVRERLAESERSHSQQIAELNAKLERMENLPPPEPSFDENPAENLRQRQERLETEQRAWNEERQRQTNEYNNRVALEKEIFDLRTHLQTSEKEFSTKHSDYDAAAQHLWNVTANNLRATGITDAAEIKNTVERQIYQMTYNARQQGLNPAEIAYALAKNSGYQHKVDATKQIKAMAEAQGRTQSMGNGKPDTAFSIAALAQMSAAELDELDLDDKTWNKIVKQS